MSREFLSTLKAGDTVIVHGGRWNDARYLGLVAKRDKVKIIVHWAGREEKFSAKYGKSGSNTFESRSLSEATPQIIEAVRAERHRAALMERIRNKVEWHKLATETLAAVVVALDADPSQRAVDTPESSSLPAGEEHTSTEIPNE